MTNGARVNGGGRQEDEQEEAENSFLLRLRARAHACSDRLTGDSFFPRAAAAAATTTRFSRALESISFLRGGAGGKSVQRAISRFGEGSLKAAFCQERKRWWEETKDADSVGA